MKVEIGVLFDFYDLFASQILLAVVQSSTIVRHKFYRMFKFYYGFNFNMFDIEKNTKYVA